MRLCFEKDQYGGKRMTKVTVRHSPECDVALADAEAYEIKNSEFIRAAIIYYHSSGGWKTSVPADDADKSIHFNEENAASDTTTDMMSDSPKADTSQTEFNDVEKVRSWQQLSSPQLQRMRTNPESTDGIRTNPWLLALSALAIVVIVYIVYRRPWEPRSILKAVASGRRRPFTR